MPFLMMGLSAVGGGITTVNWAMERLALSGYTPTATSSLGTDRTAVALYLQQVKQHVQQEHTKQILDNLPVLMLQQDTM